MSLKFTRDEAQQLVDGMTRLADRLDRARPSGDVWYRAEQLCSFAYELRVRYTFPEVYGPHPPNVIAMLRERLGTNDPDDLIPENCLARACRILRQLKLAEYHDDDARELRGVATDILALFGAAPTKSEGRDATPKIAAPAADDEYSPAMPKAEMRSRLNLRPRAFDTFCKTHPLRHLGRQLFQMRLTGMDKKTRAMLLQPATTRVNSRTTP